MKRKSFLVYISVILIIQKLSIADKLFTLFDKNFICSLRMEEKRPN
jgi:hypothetical protein